MSDSPRARSASRGLLMLLMVALCAPAGAAVPGEVTGLAIASDRQTLSWDSEPLADTYNLYRGYLKDLTASSYGNTLEGDIVATSYVDPTTPVDGQGFFYLVTAANADGEGSLGTTGAAVTRPNNWPWQGLGVAGRWGDEMAWPAVAIHSMLFHTGEVLIWAGQTNPTTTYLWNPQTDQFTTQTLNTDLFCAGHSFLADGKGFAVGGTVPLFNGRKTTWVFDPASGGSWDRGPDMLKGRYYPTQVTKGDGKVLLFSGNDESGAINPDVEMYDPKGQGSISYESTRSMIIYPAMHLLADGRVFHAGPEGQTETYDPVGRTWQVTGNTNFGRRGGGSGQCSSVLLPPGHEKVMILGGVAPGQDAATDTAEIIDFSDPTPSWTNTNPMHFPRTHPNVVILPDGKVLVAGGGFDDVTPVHPAEIFDPATEQWSVVGMMKGVFRLYHSTAILLPDGRVLWAGGTTPSSNPTAEIYSPGYMYRGARPTISSAPSSIRYGHNFTVGTPDAATIASVVWIRPSSVTHSRNMSQRYVPLSFTAGASSLSVTAPSDPDIAPLGYYMLFIVDGDGVPSEAEFIKLR